MSQPSRLMNRNFFLLWQGQLVSQLGSQAFLIAQMAWVKEATESATLVGLMTMMSMLPTVVLSPLGGVVADRYSRRAIIILSDAITGLVVLSLVLAFVLVGPVPEAVRAANGSVEPLSAATQVLLGWLLAVAVAKGVAGAFFGPAIAAAIPDLVPKDKVAAANSLQQSASQVSTFIGQGMGGVLYSLMGARLLFLVDGLTYLFSALSECFIQIPQVLKERARGLGVKHAAKEFWADAVEGMGFIWRSPWVRALVLIAAVFNFFIMPMFALLLFYVQDFLHAGVDWYGFLLAALSIGSLLGYVIAGHPAVARRIHGRLLVGLLVAAAVSMGVLGLIRSPHLAVALMLVVGLMIGGFNVSVITALQLGTPSEYRGRVFGMVWTVAGSIAPIAIGLFGVIADLIGQNIPLLFVCCAAMAAVSAVAIAARGDFQPPPAVHENGEETAAEQE